MTGTDDPLAHGEYPSGTRVAHVTSGKTGTVQGSTWTGAADRPEFLSIRYAILWDGDDEPETGVPHSRLRIAE